MSNRNASNIPGRGGGGPHGGRNAHARRNGSGRFGNRHGHPRIGDRQNGAALKDNAGKIGARPDLVVLTYCEKGSSTLLTNLKEFEDGLRIICGREFGTLFDFERTGRYPTFEPTDLITQQLADRIEINSIQDNIDDPETDEGLREELLVAIEIIRASHIRSDDELEALNRRRLETWKIQNSMLLKESVKFIENKAKLYWIIRGNLSKTSEEKLIEHLGEEWEAIQGRHDALDLWNAIVATHNAVSSGNNDMDIIKMRRHFEIIRQGPDETPLQYK